MGGPFNLFNTLAKYWCLPFISMGRGYFFCFVGMLGIMRRIVGILSYFGHPLWMLFCLDYLAAYIVFGLIYGPLLRELLWRWLHDKLHVFRRRSFPEIHAGPLRWCRLIGLAGICVFQYWCRYVIKTKKLTLLGPKTAVVWCGEGGGFRIKTAPIYWYWSNWMS